jgi:hypothetical protein
VPTPVVRSGRKGSGRELTAVVAFFVAGFLALGAAAFFGAAGFFAFGSAVFFGAAAFLVVVAFLVAVAGFLTLAAAGFLAGADLAAGLAAGLAAAGFGSFLASLVPPDDPIIKIRLNPLINNKVMPLRG